MVVEKVLALAATEENEGNWDNEAQAFQNGLQILYNTVTQINLRM